MLPMRRRELDCIGVSISKRDEDLVQSQFFGSGGGRVDQRQETTKFAGLDWPGLLFTGLDSQVRPRCAHVFPRVALRGYG